jgi:sec-independent protein translocase protein TatA
MGPSFLHILVVLVIVLVIFGAGKLPNVMRDLGKGIKGFKDGLDGKDEDEKKQIDEDKK